MSETHRKSFLTIWSPISSPTRPCSIGLSQGVTDPWGILGKGSHLRKKNEIKNKNKKNKD